MWFISATDWNRLAAVFEGDNFLAAVLTFARDSGHILHIDDVGCVNTAEIFAELFFKLFHGEAERLGSTIFFVNDDIMILGFKIEDLATAQAHILVAVCEGKGLSMLAEEKFYVVIGFFEVIFFNGLAQKPNWAAFEAFIHILTMACDKNDEHGVVDAFQHIGNLKAFFFTFHFQIEKNDIVTLMLFFVGFYKRFTVLKVIDIFFVCNEVFFYVLYFVIDIVTQSDAHNDPSLL